MADLGCTLTLTLAKVKSWKRAANKRRLTNFLCNVLQRRRGEDSETGRGGDDDGDEAEREEKRRSLGYRFCSRWGDEENGNQLVAKLQHRFL